MSYLPQVSWSTIINDVVYVSSRTYRITIFPIDVNEIGSSIINVGYYLKDYVGYTYSIIEINVDGYNSHINVYDDFNVGYGPQSGQIAFIYKSVADGDAPYLAPIRHKKLDESALDYTRAIELDVIWKHRGFSFGSNLNITNIDLVGLSSSIDINSGWYGGSKLSITNNYTTFLSLNDTPNSYPSNTLPVKITNSSLIFENIFESNITLSDNTINNASSSNHGFSPKLINDTSKYYRSDGSWSSITTSSGDFLDSVISMQIDNTLNPGAPANGNRYIILNSSNLNSGFGLIDKNLSGSALSLGNGDIVQYISSSSEFRIAYDSSAAMQPATVTVGFDKNGNSNHDWTYNVSTSQWIDRGSSTLHNSLSDLNTGAGQYYHLTSSQLSGLTGGSITSLHAHNYLSSFTESDPIFSAWNKSTGIVITKSQISDFPDIPTQYTDAMADARVIAGITNKVDKITGKGLSTNDYTNAEKVIVGNTSNVNTGDNSINSLYSGLISNATHTGDVTGSSILTLATVNSNIGTYNNVTVNSKGLVTSASNISYVTGTPWTSVGYWYSSNHPTTTSGYGLPAYPTTLPASDVYAWAKASLKPSYAWSEIVSKPTALSSFTNDLGNYGGFALQTSISNINNTSDLNKPISTATQTQLNTKQANLSGTGFVKSAVGVISYDNSTYLTTVAAAEGYEPLISAGTTAQYWRGDKSWQTLNYAAIGGTVPTWNQNTTGTAANSNLLSSVALERFVYGDNLRKTTSLLQNLSADNNKASGFFWCSSNAFSSVPFSSIPNTSVGIIHAQHYNNDLYGLDIAYRVNRLAFRSIENTGILGWNEIYHSGNLNLSTVPFTASIITATGGNSTVWNTAYADRFKWDGGSTGLVALTGRTSLGLGSAATASTSDFEVPLTFSTGLTRTGNTVTNNITQYTDALARSAQNTANTSTTGLLTSTDWNTFNNKQSALGFTPYNATNPNNYIPLTSLSSTATGLTYTNTTGIFSLTSGYAIPTTTNISTWNGLTSFPGFGTTHTTAAYGDHNHSGIYEPVFTKNTAFNKNFGTTTGTVLEGRTFGSAANNATSDFPLSVLDSDWSTAISNHRVGFNTSNVNSPQSGMNYFGIITALDGNIAYGGAIAMRNNRLFFQTNENSTLQGWSEIWHTGNFNPTNYSLTTHNHAGTYQPLATVLTNTTASYTTAAQSKLAGIAANATNVTNTNQLTNGAGFITSYTETDPTISAWAKATTKPGYTKSEIGLSNVDNTSDLLKPLSTASINALALKQNNLSGTGFVKSTAGEISYDTGDYYDYNISRTANTVLAAPNGSSGSATFRVLVPSDLPDAYLSTSGGAMISGAGIYNPNTSMSYGAIGFNITNNAFGQPDFPTIFRSSVNPTLLVGTNTYTIYHTGNLPSYQPLATVLTNITASYTIAEQSKLAGIAAGANVGVVPNSAIIGATHTKITYDAKGLVTTGSDATTSDIAEGSRLYYTDARVAANSAVTEKYSSSATRSANTVLAAPNGSAGSATFRALVAADLPTDIVTASADTYTSRAKALSLITLTQAEYDAIGTKDANTLYIIS